MQSSEYYKCTKCGYEGPFEVEEYKERSEMWGRMATHTVRECICPNCYARDAEEEL